MAARTAAAHIRTIAVCNPRYAIKHAAIDQKHHHHAAVRIITLRMPYFLKKYISMMPGYSCTNLLNLVVLVLKLVPIILFILNLILESLRSTQQYDSIRNKGKPDFLREGRQRGADPDPPPGEHRPRANAHPSRASRSTNSTNKPHSQAYWYDTCTRQYTSELKV
eukprot:SAG31_NODE_1564_length_7868_cov_5.665766_2_plen_165_part_00